MENNERGTISFWGLCMLMVVLMLGASMLHTAKTHQRIIGGNIWESRLTLAADGNLDAVIRQISDDGTAGTALPSETEVCLREVTEDGITVRVYARRTDRGIFLLSLAEGRETAAHSSTHKRRQAYLVKKDDATYEWGYYLP